MEVKLYYKNREGKEIFWKNGFSCNKCDYVWLGKKEKEIPFECPKCKSSRWNQEKKK